MLPYILFGIVECLMAVFIPIVILNALDKKEDLLYRLPKHARKSIDIDI